MPEIVCRSLCLCLVVVGGTIVTGCQPPDAPGAVRPTDRDPDAVPFDVADVIAEVELSFRPSAASAGASGSAEFVGGGDTYTVELGARDGARVAMVGVPDVALVLGRARIERDGDAVAELGVADCIAEPSGSVVFGRGGVTERYRNREEGLEQTWTFDAAPRGDGDLRVHIGVDGLVYRGTTEGGLHFSPADAASMDGTSADGAGMRYGHGTWIDAAGRHTPIPARYEDGEIALVVPASVLSTSAFPAVLDPVISPEIATDVPVAVSPAATQAAPSVASNGDAWLVVWSDSRSLDVRGVRVSSSGAVLDPLGIDVSESADTDGAPIVASNGTDYLVAWTQTDIGSPDLYARRVGATGELTSPPFVLAASAYSQFRPSIASNGTDYLVAWEDQRMGFAVADVYFARVSAAGTDLDPGGRVLAAAADRQGAPSVASVGADYFVVWEDHRGASADVYGSGVTAGGVVRAASGIAISAGAADETTPSLASDGTGYFAVWADTRPGYNDVYGTRITASGTVVEATGVVVSNAMYDQLRPRVSSNGAGYLAVWDDFRDGIAFRPFSARISSAGAVLDASGVTIPIGTSAATGLTVGSDGVGYLVAWTSGGASGVIRGLRFAGTGTVLDASALLLSPDANRQSLPAVAWNGTEYFVAWTDRRAGVDVYGTRVSRAGTVLDPAGIAISTASGARRPPRSRRTAVTSSSYGPASRARTARGSVRRVPCSTRRGFSWAAARRPPSRGTAARISSCGRRATTSPASASGRPARSSAPRSASRRRRAPSTIPPSPRRGSAGSSHTSRPTRSSRSTQCRLGASARRVPSSTRCRSSCPVRARCTSRARRRTAASTSSSGRRARAAAPSAARASASRARCATRWASASVAPGSSTTRRSPRTGPTTS